MIDLILPSAVSVAEAFDDPPGLPLLGTEAEEVSRAVDKRRREFTTARWCARRALAGLGVAPVPVPRGERGAPVWPDRIVGSLTHCQGYRAAAVARDTDLRSLGIDAEDHLPLPDGVLDMVASEAERAHLAALARLHPGCTGTGCCSARRSRCTRRGSRSPAAGSATRRPSWPSRRTGRSRRDSSGATRPSRRRASPGGGPWTGPWRSPP